MASASAAPRPGGRVVVVGHDASRSGAPVVLLTFLRWLRRRAAGPAVDVVLLAGGPLEPAYRSVGGTVVGPWRPQVARLAGALPPVLAPARSGARRLALPRHHVGGADVVVANTLAALGPVTAVARSGQRVVAWVHELDGVADRVLPPGAPREAALARVDRFVAAGTAVADMLTARWGVAPHRVEVVAPFVDPVRPADADVAAARAATGAEPAGTVVVVGAGSRGPRKGTDRFVDLAVAVDHLVPATRWAWVGGDDASAAGSELATDAAAVARPPCSALAHVADAVPFLAAADLHVTLAREDPFPVTVLEAAVAGTAVAGVDGGGWGALARAARVPVPPVPVGDLLALAADVAGLAREPSARSAQAAALADHVRAHHLTDTAAPALWEACTSW